MSGKNQKSKKTQSATFLPRVFRTDSNKKFLQATIDQLVQPGTVSKINGYIGRQNAKASTGSDIFIEASDTSRQNYQLEPGLVVKDRTGNTVFYKDYIDYINQLSVFGANTSNHARLNQEEFYSWDPHICWDKFINFQNYYWLPNGPEVIQIYGQAAGITSEYSVVLENEGNTNAFIFSPKGQQGLVRNPVIKLYRGQTYIFNINCPSNPVSIKTARSDSSADRYQALGLENGIEQGTMTFAVPYDAPNILYFQSETDIDVAATFQIATVDKNSTINVVTDILGKLHYTMQDGTALSNGMKVAFGGTVTPAEYANEYFYVEGVGNSIRLVNVKDLALVSTYTTSEDVPFDSGMFDSMPFESATSYASRKDYIVSNRASRDRNPWARYNRWFHKDVIETSARLNGNVADLSQSSRAVRPIIQFEADLRLFNFGTTAINDVDVVDSFTTDVFSLIEGSLGYNIDGVQLAAGHRVLFTADTDITVRNNIYQVSFVDVDNSGSRRIHLSLVASPVTGNVTLVKQGTTNKGQMYWFDGLTWKQGQQKISVNQQPMFDVVDESGVSFGDSSAYDGTSFYGTGIFSYKKGSGTADSELGFPLTYKNISNFGDIVFNFDLEIDAFEYKDVSAVISKKINTGFLVKSYETGHSEYVNGWKTCSVKDTQPAVRIYRNSGLVNNFDIDIFDDVTKLTDLEVRVYVNGIRLSPTTWKVVDEPAYKRIVLDTDILESDVLTIKAFSSQPINSKGYYEIPNSLQNNPLNEIISDFTLSEVSDHVGSIVENLKSFEGQFPGVSNLRDQGSVAQYGVKFVQHSAPASISMYHITSESSNVIKAIEQSRDDYAKFKRNFVIVSEQLGIDASIVDHVNAVLKEITTNIPSSYPYYLSDMAPFGAYKKTSISVVDGRIKSYPLSDVFDLTYLSNKAVYVYLNDEQLLYSKDYTFSDQGFVVISTDLAVGDIVTIYEYDSTDGCFIPETPTKLGLWPKFEPKIFVDTTYITPRTMIQGHDGSVILAYGDYRDQLILELEKRIYNNIKVEYDSSIFDVADIIPSYNRVNDYSRLEFNEVLAPNFFKWATLVDRDFTKPIGFNRNNPFTYNYSNFSLLSGEAAPGYWRAIYQWVFDTDRPNLAPWEMLGFSVEPAWWSNVYGPAPYTSDNLVMWNDIAQGFVRNPDSPIEVRSKFAKPFLMKHIPVDENGNLVDPIACGVVTGVVDNSISNSFIFGDMNPVETAWRRSSYYPFSVILAATLLTPNKVFGVLLDRARIVRNSANQLVYKDTGLRITPQDIVFPSTVSSTARVQTSGIINYLVNYIVGSRSASYNDYVYALKNIECNLGYRVGAFTSKEKFNLLLDSKSPAAASSVFVPQEDFSLILNSSSPIKKITYSGVIITKVADGFEVKGYSNTNPYFKSYNWLQPGNAVNIGGISESFAEWTPNKQYIPGKVVRYANRYYRVTVLHTSGEMFVSQNYQALPSLPVSGGQTAFMRRTFDRSKAIVVPYGTVLTSVQDVVDFLLGYGAWLEDQGFVFDQFNTTVNSVANWETSAKEFMFWTTQNWSTGEDKWDEWSTSTSVQFGTIVRYNGEYYRAIRNIEPADTFDESVYVKLDGLSTVGSSVLSLSPAAASLTFTTTDSVADDISNQFNGYEIFSVDGRPIVPANLNSYRENNTTTYSPSSDEGIYCASFYLVQKEHVVILNNTTMFNDTIYNTATGYKQDRIKVSGYVSTEWNGSFEVPGFIYDKAEVKEWSAWVDYALGDVVKYKEFYYSANSAIAGTSAFNSADWNKLESAPAPQLLPNWTYKATQFTDFYSLDSDNFDAGQQAVAQHLIGYQKRQYLSNIIQDDVSEYKFYQGMIVEKGTQNVFNKLFDVLSASGKESIEFSEEWAVRVGQYGASAAFEDVEFVLDESLFKLNPQAFELVDNVDNSKTDFIIRQTPNDIYVKPIGYNSNPWPSLSTPKPYLRSAGSVRAEDVKVIVKSIGDLAGTSTIGYSNGEYIWSTFEGASWNVYRATPASTVSNIVFDASSNTLTVTLPNTVTVSTVAGLVFPNAPAASLFYTVLNVNGNVIVLDVIENTASDVAAGDLSSAELWTVTSQKISTIDQLSSITTKNIVPGELAWIENTQSNYKGLWKNSEVFAEKLLLIDSPVASSNFGKEVACDNAGLYAAVGTTVGTAYLFYRASTYQPWIQRQRIEPEFWSNDLAGNAQVQAAKHIAMSADGTVLVTSTPDANNVNVIQVNGVNVADPSGTASGLTAQGVISVYERDLNGIYVLVNTFVSPEPANNQQFGYAISVSNSDVFVKTATGSKIYHLEKLTGQWQFASSITLSNRKNYAKSMATSDDGSILLVASDNLSNIGVVDVYSNQLGNKTLVQALTGSSANYGYSVDITNSTEFVVSEPSATGVLRCYRQVGSTYVVSQTINSLFAKSGEYFSVDAKLANSNKSLVVYTTRGSVVNGTACARVDIYDKYDTLWIYSESIAVESDVSTMLSKSSIAVGSNTVVVGVPSEQDRGVSAGRVHDWTRNEGERSWQEVYSNTSVPDVKRIKQAFVYNKENNQLYAYLDVIDPIQGKIAGIADQELTYKTFYDPAVYSQSSLVSARVDDGLAWGEEKVGELWWDLRTAKFVDCYNGDVVYRNTNWNTLVYGASIDVYEWVASEYTPDQWDSITDTEEGLALGISGTSFYTLTGDSSYSVRYKFDTVSKTNIPTYYFWVKNRSIVPSAKNREISAASVADLISNPRGQDYQYLALLSPNSFSIANARLMLNAANSVLAVEYWTTESTDRVQNIHSQWKIISDVETVVLPNNIEKKWFDSLCGKDVAGREVPDSTLPAKLKFGIENRPRQSMFVNRFEAVKQLIEHANLILKNSLIVDSRDLSKLMKADSAPNPVSGLFDVAVDTYDELEYSQTSLFVRPQLEAVVADGKIVGVNVLASGQGYVNAPYIEVVGTGVNAVLRSVIDDSGKIISVSVLNSGEGYAGSTTLVVRNFAVLVRSDVNTYNNWSIYGFDPVALAWSKVVSQGYDTTKYWSYIDWYDSRFNQFTAIDFSVDTFADLASISSNIGNTVKVRSTNTGAWVLLEKYADATNVDWTQQYRVVGKQNGTIQLSKSIYEFDNTTVGYDGTLYDSSLFDNVASTELRNILDALKEDIFIDDLRKTYIDLFFNSIRYLLSEQSYVDWIFKTSFIRAKHNVGELKQPVNYKNDNLSNFEDYISEVKPYRTKVREYVSNYTKTDASQTAVTDFDLQPMYGSSTNNTIVAYVKDDGIFSENAQIMEYPWKFWLDNAGMSVTEIRLIDGGSGYQSAPKVNVVSNSGSGATATAYISNGRVSKVILQTSGSGYLSSPTIEFVGGLSLDGTPAKAVCIVNTAKPRTTLIKMKFDRVAKSYSAASLTVSETFTAAGTLVQFALKWVPDFRVGTVTVTINGNSVLSDLYTVSYKKVQKDGYTDYVGLITFKQAPASGSVIQVDYAKNWAFMSAADRINYFYDPSVGEIGNRFNQLMQGVDFGGTIVNGLNFDVTSSWDSRAYFSDRWDSVDPTYDDYLISVSSGITSVQLPYTPEAGTDINVYWSKDVESVAVSDGAKTIYNFDTELQNVTVNVSHTVKAATGNTAGSYTLNLVNTSSIQVGDVVSSAGAEFGYNCQVVSVVNTGQVLLDQMLYLDIASGTDITVTRLLKVNADFVINTDQSITLVTAAAPSSNVIISGQTKPVWLNNYAVTMSGTTDVVDISPIAGLINAGDILILRKSTSDGSIAPNAYDYDTAIDAGNMAYTTATGLLPEDIIIDGSDGLVTPSTCPATEEVVPGQVVDTLAIKVYEKPKFGQANVTIDRFETNGLTAQYALSQQPNSPDATIVKLTNSGSSTILTQGIDYTYDYSSNVVTLTQTPAAGQLVSVFGYGFSGNNVLDVDYFVADGVTDEFVTKASWVPSSTALVYVNGIKTSTVIFETDNTYERSGYIGLRVPTVPAAGSVVNYMLVEGSEQTFAVTSKEVVVANGVDYTYDLAYETGTTLPIESNIVVRVDDQILTAPQNIYFDVKGNKYSYSVDQTLVPLGTIDIGDVTVIAAGTTVLTKGVDYQFDLTSLVLKVTQSVAKSYAGTTLVLSIATKSGYYYTPPLNGNSAKITFTNLYNSGNYIEVISSFRHDSLDIRRSDVAVATSFVGQPDSLEYCNYVNVQSGMFRLDRQVQNDSYIWVIKNGKLLTSNIDFVLLSDKQTVQLAAIPDQNDSISIVTFGSNLTAPGVAFMQFKDMLNRVHFKRLSLSKQTVLVEPVYPTSTEIHVKDASNFNVPDIQANKPGVIELNGERIEYFTLTGNVLGQLRRGTLGTGVAAVYPINSTVQDIGASETIPYFEQSGVRQIVSNGSNLIDVDFTPIKSEVQWDYRNTIPADFGQCDYVEVFVGGYETATNWASKVQYSAGELVQVGVYTYKCLADHVSTTFENDRNYWQFFVGNIRLKKHPYAVWNANVAATSPAGDVWFDADFAVDGVSNQIRLTTPIKPGVKITVVYRTLGLWNVVNGVEDPTTEIAKFVTSQEGARPVLDRKL